MKAWISVAFCALLVVAAYAITPLSSCTIPGTGDYYLTADLYGPGGCFDFSSAPDSSIDCRGHSVTGDGTGTMLFSDGGVNVTIKNCIISNFTDGLNMFDNAPLIAYNNTFSNISGFAIGQTGGGGAGTIAENNTINSAGYGMYMQYNVAGRIYNNTITADTCFYATGGMPGGSLYYLNNCTANHMVAGDAYADASYESFDNGTVGNEWHRASDGMGLWEVGYTDAPYGEYLLGESLWNASYSFNAYSNPYGGGIDNHPYPYNLPLVNFTIYNVTAVSNCRILNNSNTIYMLSTSFFNDSFWPIGDACFPIIANDIVFDCNGKSVDTGSSESTYVFKSSANQTVVRNCPFISGGGGGGSSAIRLAGRNGLAQNVSVGNASSSTATVSGCIYLFGYNNSIKDAYCTSYEDDGIAFGTLGTACTNCSVNNFTVINREVGSHDCILVDYSTNSSVSNITGVNCYRGVVSTHLSSNTQIDHVSIVHNNSTLCYGYGDPFPYGHFNIDGSDNTTIRNVNVNSTCLNKIGVLATNLYSNAIISDNAFYLPNGTGLRFDFAGSNVNAYHNRITAPVWVNNSAANTFNTSSQGNAYYFVNGTPACSVYNCIDTNGDGYADAGTSVPFNATTVGGNWSGIDGDWHPLVSTEIFGCMNITAPGGYMQASDLTAPSGVPGYYFHCINLWGNDITYDCNWRSISGGANQQIGIYSNGSNNIIKNCVINLSNEWGIFLVNATNITVNNILSSSESGQAIEMTNTTNSRIINITTNPTTLEGVWIHASSNNYFGNLNIRTTLYNAFGVYEDSMSLNLPSVNNTFENCIGYTPYVSLDDNSPCFILNRYAINNTLRNVTCYSANSSALETFDLSSGNYVTGSNFSTDAMELEGSTACAAQDSGDGLVLTNNLFTGTKCGILFSSAGTDGISINNTIQASSWFVSSYGGGVGCSVNDSVRGNRYLFLNGSDAWPAFNWSDMNGDHWADNGSALPVNNANVGGNWTLPYCEDWHPYTLRAGPTPPLPPIAYSPYSNQIRLLFVLVILVLCFVAIWCFFQSRVTMEDTHSDVALVIIALVLIMITVFILVPLLAGV